MGMIMDMILEMILSTRRLRSSTYYLSAARISRPAVAGKQLGKGNMRKAGKDPKTTLTVTIMGQLRALPSIGINRGSWQVHS